LRVSSFSLSSRYTLFPTESLRRAFFDYNDILMLVIRVPLFMAIISMILFKNRSLVQAYKGLCGRGLLSGKVLFCQTSEVSSPPVVTDTLANIKLNTENKNRKVEDAKQHIFSVAPMMEYTGQG
jgi:hypothetical protein